MDMQTTTPASRPTPINEELFDDFDFKPLSQGLGFHHGNKAQEAVKEATRVVAERAQAQPARLPQKSSHPFEQHRLSQASTPAPQDFVQNDLALFYAAKSAPALELPGVTVSERMASMPLRLAAFTVDLGLVTGLTALTIQAVAVLTDMPLWNSLLVWDATMLGTLGVLFGAYFLMYFTLLETLQGRSIGKDVMGLKLVSSEGLPIGVVLLRSVATLLGFLSLGLTNAVDLPAKLTGTRVVRA